MFSGTRTYMERIKVQPFAKCMHCSVYSSLLLHSTSSHAQTYEYVCMHICIVKQSVSLENMRMIKWKPTKRSSSNVSRWYVSIPCSPTDLDMSFIVQNPTRIYRRGERERESEKGIEVLSVKKSLKNARCPFSQRTLSGSLFVRRLRSCDKAGGSVCICVLCCIIFTPFFSSF